MLKLLLCSLGVTLYYMLIVFLLEGQRNIFPVFMITSFFFSMFLSKREMIYSFSLLFIIWLIHPFLEGTILSHSIIYMIFTPLTFWLGFYLKNRLWVYKVVYPILLISIGLYGFSNFWCYVENFEARQYSISPEMIFYSENELVRLDTIKDKIIVLDYWTTNCGVCFQKFPDFDKVYQDYKDNSNVLMYTVNIPIKRDTIGQAKKMIARFNYQFPVLYADSDKNPISLGFNGYPRLIILKNGKIRYNGSLVLNDKIYIHRLEDEIELLLKEDM